MKPASSQPVPETPRRASRQTGPPVVHERECQIANDIPLAVVLAVGFDPRLLKVQRSIRASRGYEIVAAESIQKAIECIHKLDFDLVLLGRRLSLGDQGRLTFLLRSSGCRVPVICVTNSSNELDVSSSANGDSDPETLLRSIAAALAKIAGAPKRCTDSTAIFNENDSL